jgi:DNA-binding NarL/FixJ family response regulator
MEPKKASIRSVDWQSLAARAGELSSQQQEILALLVTGLSTPAIARRLGRSRSGVWREVVRLRALLATG